MCALKSTAERIESIRQLAAEGAEGIPGRDIAYLALDTIRCLHAEIIEACAKVAEPKSPRPCDCERCYCHNQGDADAVAAWDAEMAVAINIRALAPDSLNWSEPQ